MTDQTSAEIVRRLREFRCWSVRRGHYEPLPLCEEAASLIESLSAEKAGEQEFVDMLWKWFEDRGCDLRLERTEGLSADDFKIMLDEHEAALAAESTVARLTGEKNDPVGGSPVAPKKIVCHASGDRCLGCAHYHGRAPACDFAGVAK